MTLGSRSRRVATGFAAWTLAALAGCHAMPVGRLAPTPNRPQATLATAGRAALLPATVAMDPPSEMASFEPVKIPPSSITRAEPDPEAGRPAPTPLLDAALLRARNLEEAAVGKPVLLGPTAPPEPSTTPTPTPEARPKAEIPVVATSAAQPPEPVKEPEPARAEDPWRDGVRRLMGLARARIESSPPNGPTTPSSWGLRARVLAWLAEPDLDPELGPREADGVRAVLRALDDSPGDSPRRGDEVRSAVLALEEKAPLEITDLRLCCKVDDFGVFEAFDLPVRRAGEQVILYCELDGLHFEQTAAGFRTRVATQLEVLPEGGGPAIQSRSLPTAEETCRRRRRDYYLPYRFYLPTPLAPGDYRVRLTIKDLNSERTASREVNFTIAKD